MAASWPIMPLLQSKHVSLASTRAPACVTLKLRSKDTISPYQTNQTRRQPHQPHHRAKDVLALYKEGDDLQQRSWRSAAPDVSRSEKSTLQALVEIGLNLMEGAVISSNEVGRSMTRDRVQAENEVLQAEVKKLSRNLEAGQADSEGSSNSESASTGSTRLQNQELKEEISRLKAQANEILSNQVQKLQVRGQTLDLAFLIDITGSMQSYIDMVREEVAGIAGSIASTYPQLHLRVAFVGYRDYHDKQPLEHLDFVHFEIGQKADSIFTDFVSKIVAIGGGDAPEDVYSGLSQAADLNWQSVNRILVHIADSPCHGTSFHDLIYDSYPGGDLPQRDIAAILDRLRNDVKIDTWLFCHLTAHTHKMLGRFSDIAGLQADDWIQQLGEADLSNIPERITEVSTSTIASSLRRGGKRQYIQREVDEEVPDWTEVAGAEAQAYRTNPKLELDSMLKAIRYDNAIPLEQREPVFLKIASSPFSSKGGLRWPFYAKYEAAPELPEHRTCTNFVAKRFKDPVAGPKDRVLAPAEVHSRHKYEDQMEIQAVAARLAQEFNHLCTSRDMKDTELVNFSQVFMIIMGEGTAEQTIYNMEKQLDGTWVKHSSNFGYVNEKDYAATVHAFQHWTYERTDGLLLVSDIQGVKQKNAKGVEGFWLCDPVIHCEAHLARFCKTNLGAAGYEEFFRTHKCNDVCCQLGLSTKVSKKSKAPKHKSLWALK